MSHIFLSYSLHLLKFSSSLCECLFFDWVDLFVWRAFDRHLILPIDVNSLLAFSISALSFLFCTCNNVRLESCWLKIHNFFLSNPISSFQFQFYCKRNILLKLATANFIQQPENYILVFLLLMRCGFRTVYNKKMIRGFE